MVLLLSGAMLMCDSFNTIPIAMVLSGSASSLAPYTRALYLTGLIYTKLAFT